MIITLKIEIVARKTLTACKKSKPALNNPVRIDMQFSLNKCQLHLCS